MRILATIHDFPPSARGGSELYTYHLARKLQRQGHEVELLFAEESDGWAVERREHEGLPCAVLRRPIPRYHNLFGKQEPRVDRVLAERLSAFRPDVLHVNHLLHLSTDIARLAHLHGVPVVFTLHDYWLRCPRITLLDSAERICETATTGKCVRCCRDLYSRFVRYPLRTGVAGLVDRAKSRAKLALWGALETPPAYQRMRAREEAMRKLVPDVDTWIAPSRFLRQAMINWGLPAERIRLLPHGMSRVGFDPSRRARRDGRLRFGYVGTISRHKGVHVLLEAFRGLREADLVIYGRRAPRFYAPYGDVLAQGNVHVMGLLLDDAKPDAYAALDALIVPSIWFENAPLTIREAFLAGVPVICSDIGGMKEAVTDGVDGFHFRVGRADDLRRLIRRCIEDPAGLRGLRPRPEDVPGMPDHVRSHLVPRYAELIAAQREGHPPARPGRAGEGGVEGAPMAPLRGVQE
jgi:glycosyltransferase involved in cell wall biosynthesis